MKQTALEWLTEKLRIEFGFVFSDNIMEQAKAMEKKQMKALYTMHMVDKRTMELYDFDEYYNETFNK